MRRFSPIALTLAAALTAALLAACGSLGRYDDIEDILRRNPDARADLAGTVLRVDTGDRRIDLDVEYINDLRNERRDDSAIYYDSSTVVEYGGDTYEPADLERGDEIEVEGGRDGDRFVADRIVVTRNVREDG